jgi:hypothetical protein
MIHGELFDLAGSRSVSRHPQERDRGQASPPGSAPGHLHLVGSRNAASSASRRNAPDQDRPGGVELRAVHHASGHHGWHLTPRGRNVRAWAQVVFWI